MKVAVRVRPFISFFIAHCKYYQSHIEELVCMNLRPVQNGLLQVMFEHSTVKAFKTENDCFLVKKETNKITLIMCQHIIKIIECAM